MCGPSLLSRWFRPKQPSVPAPSRTPEGTLSSVICCLHFFQAVGKNVLGELWRKDKGAHGNVAGRNKLVNISQLFHHVHHLSSDELDKAGVYLCASSLHGSSDTGQGQRGDSMGRETGLAMQNKQQLGTTRAAPREKELLQWPELSWAENTQPQLRACIGRC